MKNSLKRKIEIRSERGQSLTEFALTPKAFAAAIDQTTYQALTPVGLNEGLPGSVPTLSSLR